MGDSGMDALREQALAAAEGLFEGEQALVSVLQELEREHPAIGERILRPLPGLAEVATAVRHEHERWDGAGYPDGLAGEEIPLASRVVLACDAWHALVSDRPYRKALPFETALEEMRAFVTVAAAVAAAHALDEVIEIAAEEARRAIGASTVSISRLENEGRTLRTLINVGDLAPWEERVPT